MICSMPNCPRTTAGCPICMPQPGPLYQLPPAPVFIPPGCICPPTSEKACESPACPRKNHLSASGPVFGGSTETVVDAKAAHGKGTA